MTPISGILMLSKCMLALTLTCACIVSHAPCTADPNPDFIPFPGPTPKTPVEPGVKMDLPPYRPCYYNKHNSKPGHGGTSFSCVANGYTVATGKYGLINLDGQGMRVGWARDDKTGELKQVNNPELFEGTEQGAMLSASAPAPSRA